MTVETYKVLIECFGCFNLYGVHADDFCNGAVIAVVFSVCCFFNYCRAVRNLKDQGNTVETFVCFDVNGNADFAVNAFTYIHRIIKVRFFSGIFGYSCPYGKPGACFACVMGVSLRNSLVENIFGVRRKTFKNIAHLPCPVAAFILITVSFDKNHACVCHGFGNRRRRRVGNRLCLFGKIVFNGTGSDRNTRSTFYRSNNNCVFINNAIIFNIE